METLSLPGSARPGEHARTRPLVLHVEDNEATRYLVARLLARGGFDVVSAATGREAMLRLSERPDAILLDVKLPDVTGFQLCRHLRGDPRAATLPIVHLSASHPLPDDQRYGLSVGADAYLVHPVDGAVLTETLRRLIGRATGEGRGAPKG
ncbi:response regulator transcription factor [Anaeromyxobacter terrae]|uniref:response regulator transcription factor n=1 Tax=Anaeromyxobacter terrae TaxID=2925406 RepID=UPI001F58A1FC|nr:response regulator [Anaeromyxobacter sp. SG22]